MNEEQNCASKKDQEIIEKDPHDIEKVQILIENVKTSGNKFNWLSGNVAQLDPEADLVTYEESLNRIVYTGFSLGLCLNLVASSLLIIFLINYLALLHQVGISNNPHSNFSIIESVSAHAKSQIHLGNWVFDQMPSTHITLVLNEGSVLDLKLDSSLTKVKSITRDFKLPYR